MKQWREALAVYLDRRVLSIMVLGFSSGLPLLLTFSTLSAWLKTAGVGREAVGAFALVSTPYALKFLWSPLIDRLAPPGPLRRLGRRRGWGLGIQAALVAAVLGLATCDPAKNLELMAVLAVVVAFLSASQDIVIDAYRVEFLAPEAQGAGAAVTQGGYRFAMLVAGAGALYLAEAFGWFVAYATMAALLSAGILVFLFNPEPEIRVSPATVERERRAAAFLDSRPHLHGHGAVVLAWLYGAVVCPFAEFMARPQAWAILVFVVGYKLGEAMAGAMATPLYIELGFQLSEIATVSKLFGFWATILGSVAGGVVAARMGLMPALLLCGLAQSAGNLFYVVQAQAGHDLVWLAVCVAAENLTAGMAGAVMVAYLSSLCNSAYTATQYALLSSLAAVGRSLFASTTGVLATKLGWPDFFVFTTLVTLPALALLLWMMRQDRRALAGCGPR